MSDSTELVKLAVERGMLAPDQADAACVLAPEELVRRGLLDRRELDTLLRLAGTPRVMFDRYELVEEIGRGGMGIVYKCRDRKLDRLVALKTMKSYFGDELDRFAREAQTAARLKHPNIVAVHDYGRAGDEVYLTMDYVAGKSLDRLVGADLLDARQIAAIVQQVASALAYAHRQSVIHRDIKPENILVDDKGRAFLTDFGLARRLEGDARLTVTGSVMGTPAYMSPEQALGVDVDPRSDVYNLGATLYFALTRVLPHQGDSPLEVAMDVLDRDPPAPRAIRPTVPRDLETICLKAMERDPDRRYERASEFTDDLERFLKGEAVLARPPSVIYRVRRRVLRHRAVLGVAAAGLAALGVVSIILVGRYLRERDARESAQAAEIEEGRRRDAARPHLDAGRGVLEDINLLLTTETSTHDDIHAMAERARAYFERAMEAHPDDPDALLGIARAWDVVGDEARALEFCTKAIEASDGFGTAYLERARLRLIDYEGMRHAGRGDDVFEESDESRALLTAIREDLAGVRRWSTDEVQLRFAEGALAFADGDYARAAAVLEAYAAERRADPLGWEWAGHAWLHAHDGERALRALQAALEYRPLSRRVIQLIGLVHADRHDVARALEQYDRLIDLDPHSANAWYNRGLARLEADDNAGAEADFTEAIRIHPGYEHAFMERGVARVRMERYAEAVEDLSRGLELYGGERTRPIARAKFNRGSALYHLGRFDEARGDLDEAVALEPGFWRVYVARGLLRKQTGDPAGAIEDYTTAIGLKPGDPTAYNNRAVVHMDLEQYDEALADVDRALAADPNCVRAFNTRGLVRQKLAEFDAAIEAFGRAIEIDGGYYLGWFNRANVYKQTKRWEPAAADYRRALELAPADWPMRETAERRLAAVLEATPDF